MNRTIRAALIQAAWTGSVTSMVDQQVAMLHQAADQGAQVACLQELCNGPYFAQVQDRAYYALAEAVPGGATVQRMQQVAESLNMVLVVPLYEQDGVGVYYNTAAVIDADGRYLGKYRKTHLPQLPGFWEKFYFRPGNLGYPVFQTQVGRIGVYICYDRHFPEGARCLGLNGAELVLIEQTRQTWQFYRDRRPDQYQPICQP
ncbi:MAG: hypothetical protein MUF49_16705 [Oculatellaceae cyanobacterium Prado106]|jgi:N-carbamoylputrescine amidase|nr:hypothetical protein [Oculatellaceae cyanobacterium Prado106]